MQEIIQSLYTVTSAAGFWFYMGGVVSLGMVIGNRFDESYKGFRKSVFLLSPYVILLILTNASRIAQIGFEKPLDSMAYNGLITIGIITIFYITGLFLGHVILRKAHKEVEKKAQ